MTGPTGRDTAAVLAAPWPAWRPPADAIGIIALGQAGVALVGRHDCVLIDPFLSPRPDRVVDAPVDPGDLIGITAVLATHEHGDHLDLPAWTRIAAASPGARFVVPEPLRPLAIDAGVPDDRVTGARLGSPLRVGDAHVTPVPARHAVRMTDGYSLGDDGGRAARFLGYVVEIDGIRVYHAGDTLPDDRIVRAVAELRPDVALLPINGRDSGREARGIVGNLTPDEAARLACEVSATLAIPIHFDVIHGNLGRPEAFLDAMRAHHPTGAVRVLANGTRLVWPEQPGLAGTAGS